MQDSKEQIAASVNQNDNGIRGWLILFLLNCGFGGIGTIFYNIIYVDFEQYSHWLLAVIDFAMWLLFAGLNFYTIDAFMCVH